MAFFQIDPLNLIPANLRTAMRDTLVDFISEQAKKHLGDEVAVKLSKLRSDAAFNKQFEDGLQRAVKRFAVEYEQQDEDLVAAITAQSDFFRNEAVQKALLAVLKQPGASLFEEQERLAQSFQSVLPERKNRQRVDKAVVYLLRCLAEELWHLPELQPIYSLQFQRLTAEASRQQVELQKAQLMTLTELNSGLKGALLQLTDAIAERKLLLSGEASTFTDHPRVYHNLPQPDYKRFIGREEEINQIYQILRPYPLSQSHLVVIDGIGGVGKSALALEIAFRYLRNYDKIPAEERFDAIIWVSAKQNVLTADGIKLRSYAFKTLGDICTTVAITLRREDIIRADLGNQAEITRNALKQQRTLLIVDNLETVSDDNVVNFLRELPAPTKAIVTTRLRIDVAYSIRLAGMPQHDAWRLINQECSSTKIKPNDEQISQLYKRTGGVPLAIVWSLAQVRSGHSIEEVLYRLGKPTNDITRFCFEGIIPDIKSTSAYKILLSLLLFTKDASSEALGYVSELSELDKDDGLAHLEKLSLVNRVADRHSLLSLTKAYVSTELASYPGRQRLAERYYNYYFESLNSLAASEALISSKGDNLMSERENLLGLIENYKLVDPNRTIELISVFAHFLHYFGYWAELLEQCKYGLKYVGHDDEIRRANFLSLIGRAKLFQKNFKESEEFLAEALQLYKNLQDDDAYAGTLLYYANVLKGLGRKTEVHSTLEAVLEIAKSNNCIGVIARAQNALAFEDISNGDLEIAKERLLDAKSIFENIDRDRARGLAPTHRLLARIELKKRNFVEADKLLQRSLEISENTNFTLDLAYSHRDLGSLYQSKLSFAQSLHHFKLAIDYFQRLGMDEDVEEIKRSLAQLENQ
ncbi:MAG: tetratricopeptide repeat protein [Chloroflexota bacterium]